MVDSILADDMEIANSTFFMFFTCKPQVKIEKKIVNDRNGVVQSVFIVYRTK